jgi:hypothetical protein
LKTVLPSVAVFLSLMQTRTITYVVTQTRVEVHDSPCLLQCPRTRLDKLVIDARQLGPSPLWDDAISLPNLMRSFDPHHLELIAKHGRESPVEQFFDLPEEADWTGLRLVTFHNAVATVPLSAAQNLVSHAHPLDLVYDFTCPQNSRMDLKDDLLNVRDDLEGTEGRPPLRLGRVQVWLNDDGQVALAKGLLKEETCLQLDIGIKP